MRQLLIALVLAPTAGAADFRALNFGESCATAQAWEQARGSVAIPSVSGSLNYKFTGFDFSRDLVIDYFCPKGALFTGNYSFPVEPLDTAVSSYRAAYDLLISTYGAPMSDNTPWQVGSSTKDPRVVNANPRKYLTAWKTTRAIVSMMMEPGAPSETSGWRVFIVVGPVRK